MKNPLVASLVVTGLWSAFAQALTQQQLAGFAAGTDFHFGVISNFDASGNGLKAHVLLHNQSAVALPAGEGNWRIYFHSVRDITAPDQAGLHLNHINGDLMELIPTKAFTGLAVGDTLEFAYSSGEWAVSYSDFMPRAFIAQPGLAPAIFANTDTEDLSRFVEPIVRPEQQLRYGAQGKADLFPIVTAASRYQDNLAVNQAVVKPSQVAQRIIPAPKAVNYRSGVARLDASWQIRYEGRLTREALYLQQQLDAVGLHLDAQPDNLPASGKVIQLSAGDQAAAGGALASSASAAASQAESYSLVITGDKVLIKGEDNAGAFYGIESLLALLPAGRLSQVGQAGQVDLPQLSINDGPRFSWRGMHYDTARNFHGKAVTLRLIDQMAHYKLNKLHLHLTDDEGWRLQIPGLPELTEIGGQRCFDLAETRCLLTQLGAGPNTNGSGNGFFSTADFIEILKYASLRHIEVIPEIDMPGHSRAAIKSMQARYQRLLAAGQKDAATQYLLSDPADKSQYKSVQNYTDDSVNVCLPSTYAFAEKVIYELQQMYRAAGLKLAVFHMGGDEVGKGSWTASPACAALFAKSEQGVAGIADLKPYFVSKIAAITQARGLNLAGWEDGLMYDPANTFNRKQFANDKVYADAWDNIWEWGVADRAYRLANAGYQVILAPGTHLYFDHPYEANPQERGYYWATRYTDTAKVFGFMPDNYYANAQRTRDGSPIANLEALVGRDLPPLRQPANIVGIQGEVWSETIRTGEQLEQMIYPRVIALAERAWSKADWESDKPDTAARQQAWAVFAHTLAQKELPKLAAAGSAFYLPPPGGVIRNGQLLANVAYPGLLIEYSLDKGKTWNSYARAVPVAVKAVALRSRLDSRYSRVVMLEEDGR